MTEIYPLPITRAEESGKKPLRLVRAAARIAVIVHENNEQKCLFVRHQTKGLELPGGAMETGEEPLQTALREIAEEAGVQLPPQHPVQLLDMVPVKDHRGGDWLDIMYATEATPEQLSVDGEAELPILWLTRAEIEQQVNQQRPSYHTALKALEVYPL